jgi:hypothetical protein
MVGLGSGIGATAALIARGIAAVCEQLQSVPARYGRRGGIGLSYSVGQLGCETCSIGRGCGELGVWCGWVQTRMLCSTSE